MQIEKLGVKSVSNLKNLKGIKNPAKNLTTNPAQNTITPKTNHNNNYTYSIYSSNNPYKELAFGYKLRGTKDAHLDYFGANINPKTNKTTFRVYSTKDKIELQIAKKDHDKKYWQELTPKEQKALGVKTYEMKKHGRVFEFTPDEIIPEGSLYRFKVVDSQGNSSFVKDPRSYYQPHDAMGWSATYNQNSYKWNDEKWQKGLDTRRIKHDNSHSNWGASSTMVISEKHIGLLGGYEKAKEEIENIAKDGICNTVYFLPTGEFFGKYNVGYDEVDKFAPESSYGKPDELKSLVDFAHQKGINVILDVVPNHFGFIGSSVGQFAQATDENRDTGWGAALKFNGKDGEYMRKYMADMMINWLVNFHFDGLRIDATEKLESDPSLKYFASEIRNHKETKDAILIPEHVEKTRKLAQPLYEHEIQDPLKTFDEASWQNNPADRLGYDIQYTYDFKNTLMSLAYGMQIYDCPASIYDLAREFEIGNKFYDETSAHLDNPKATNSFVYFNMHDEANVFGGVKPVIRGLSRVLGLAKEDRVYEPDGLDKRPYLEAEKLLEDYLKGDYHSKKIPKETFKRAYETAKAKNRLMLALTFMHPANKGFSMGDEVGELAPLRYFAQYETDEIKKSVDFQKGYDVGEESFKKSSKLYNKTEDKNFKTAIKNLSQDFTRIINENTALKHGDYNKTIAQALDNDSIFVHRWSNDGNDIFAVANFGDYEKTITNISQFPDGSWREILNTDDKKYSGSGLVNSQTLDRDNTQIKLAPNSFALFKRQN